MFRIATALLAVVLVAPAAHAGGGACTTFTDQAAFEEFVLAAGKYMKGLETFEEGVIDDGGKQPMPAPLAGGVPNVVGDFGFPEGLSEPNLVIQDNITPGPSPATANPSGSSVALYLIGAGFIGTNSKKVGEDLEILEQIEASTDLIFVDSNKTAVGFELSHFDGFGNGDWHISAFDENDVLLGKWVLPDPGIVEPTKTFFGIFCSTAIGRINIWDVGLIPDAVDNIQMWELDDPTSVDASSWGTVKARYAD